MSQLRDMHCTDLPTGSKPLDTEALHELLAEIGDWHPSDDFKAIEREFRFPDYYHTMAFVNAVAWIAHREDHHPDMSVHYNRCRVRFSTHSVGGLSRNDFICAARVDALIDSDADQARRDGA